jgi:hypothetical protein
MHAISNRCMEATIVNTSKDHKLPNTTEKGKLVASNALETQATRPERKHTGLARAKSAWGARPDLPNWPHCACAMRSPANERGDTRVLN